MNLYKKCILCPRKCMVNRYVKKGFCGMSNKIKIALAKPFFYEEPNCYESVGRGLLRPARAFLCICAGARERNRL